MAAKGQASAKAAEAKAIAAEENESSTRTRFNAPTRLTGAEIIWATLVGEGVDTRFRLSGRNDSSRLRRFAEVSRAPYPGAPRAGRGAHGRRLRARFRRCGRGHCHQRSRLDQSGHRHCHRDARFHSHGVHYRERVIKALGTDAFQEVDITGITLPVTKHNFLVSRAEDIAPAIRHAFQIAQQSSGAGSRRHHQGCQKSTARSLTLKRPSRVPTARIPCCTWAKRNWRRRPS